MSCDIAQGRTEQCKDSIAGLDAIYFVNYGEYDPETDVTYSATSGLEDMIDTMSGITTVYKFELKGTNSYQETVNTSRENGTTFFTQELTVTLKKQDAKTHKTVKLLSYGRPHIFVRGRDNTYRIAGLFRGCDVSAATIASGTEMGDLVGYNLTFTGMENIPGNFINANTEADFLTAIGSPSVVTT
jgi:hypothetical protein